MKRNHVIGPLSAQEVERVVRMLANEAAVLRRLARLGKARWYRITKVEAYKADGLVFAARVVAIAARRDQ